jgi:TRAP-type C4-dicarboxylate transport system permease large subunit
MHDIYASIWPFVLLMAGALALVMIFPEIALWLPRALHRQVSGRLALFSSSVP